jgi:Transglycosylase SLT domain
MMPAFFVWPGDTLSSSTQPRDLRSGALFVIRVRHPITVWKWIRRYRAGMAGMVRLGPAVPAAAASHRSSQAGHAGRRQAGPAFHHVLAAAMARARTPRIACAMGPGIQTAALQVAPTMAHPGWVEKPAATIPAQADAALTQAMTLEGVPQSWQSGLEFIMAQESGGQVNVQNPVHSARGLFQLTAANYHLNPNGAGSFGNPVEEAQGGIRYIQQRYGTADNAVAFWRQHHWY